MDPALIGALGALGGVVVTGGIGLTTAVLNHRWQEDSRLADRGEQRRQSRAELRRDAYTRFLIATDSIVDFVLTQVPDDEDESSDDPNHALTRLRELRASGEKHFVEFDACRIHVRLLGGPEVIRELTEFEEWLVGQIRPALLVRDVLGSGALSGMEDERQPLLEAMRGELEADLSVSG
jgi:hypothetical protein